ncbi:hypothetical protein [Lysobacter sp. D1-1-M9]|uniref:hypothetical protein n=1 Tax=Novilysobacter longmucuonensis TaxID=3098603 RepID=UPI002FC71551
MLRLLGQLGTRDRVAWQQQQLLTLVDRPYPVTIRLHRLPAPLHLLPSLLGAGLPPSRYWQPPIGRGNWCAHYRRCKAWSAWSAAARRVDAAAPWGGGAKVMLT